MDVTVRRLERNMAEEYIDFLIKEPFLTEARREGVIVCGIIGQNNMN